MDEYKKDTSNHKNIWKLIETRESMDNIEKDILSMILMQLSSDDEDFKEYTLKMSDFINVYGERGRSIFENIGQSCRLIMREKFRIETEKGSIMTSSIITSIEVAENKEEAKVILDPKLKKLLAELRNKLTYAKIYIRPF